MNNRIYKELLTVIFISLLFIVFLYFPIIYTFKVTPINTINMLVGHYYEDYYFYLSFIKQGQMGHLIIQNLFTNDDPVKFFIPWWPFSFFGIVSRISPIYIPIQNIYWIAAALLNFIFVILAYTAISKLLSKDSVLVKICTFLLFILSTPLFKLSTSGGISIIPYSNESPFSRFSYGTPHHIVGNVVFILALLSVCKYAQSKSIWKKLLLILIFSILLLSLSATYLILFWLSYATTTHLFAFSSYKTKTSSSLKNAVNFIPHWLNSMLPFILAFVCLIPFMVYTRLQITSSPTVTAARNENIYYPPLVSDFLSKGIVFLIGFLGIGKYITKFNFNRILFLNVTIWSFIFIHIPLNVFSINILKYAGVNNLRFSTIISYIFFVVATMELIKILFRTQLKIFIASSLLILSFLPLQLIFWKSFLPRPTDWNIIFMPKDLYHSIRMLEKIPTDSTILTSPDSNLGLVIPALSGKKVFIGRSLFTFDLGNKKSKANLFYTLQLSSDETRQFLSHEKIGYILLTPRDGDSNAFMNKYLYLRTILKNSELTIMQSVL